ncbi:MAG: class I SAM-dependent methyltransferase [Propionibacteriaceae bacterium]|jgi:SAM-dependent methyltransferase|nr:class I SAM-dependent methyltransferase [Propionibacteriaceae bacterium]
MASRLVVQPAALEWLLGERPASVLVIGAAGGYPALFSSSGHEVTVVDRSFDRIAPLANTGSRFHGIVARGEALPFDPCCFDFVAAVQNFHTFAPGLALSEWARVLKPGGRIGLAYFVRDDSVPWVKKLARVIQTRLPDAMRGDYGDAALKHLDDSPFFPQAEERRFRLWVPCSRAALQAQTANAVGASRLKATDLEALSQDVGRLYDQYARSPEPLQLPYALVCRRAVVDHTELTAALVPDQAGLRIVL